MFGRMVHHMGSPPKPLVVRNVMCPIAAKIIEYIAWQKGPPTKLHTIGQQVINENSQAEKQKLNGGTDEHIANPNHYRTPGFLSVVISLVLVLRNSELYQNAQKHEGCSPGDKVGGTFIKLKQFMVRNGRSTKECEKRHSPNIGLSALKNFTL